MVSSISFNYDDFRKLNSNKLKIMVSNILKEHPEGITVDKLVELTGLNRSTIYNYLEYLKDRINLIELGFKDYILNKKRIGRKVYYSLIKINDDNINYNENIIISSQNNYNKTMYTNVNHTIKLNKPINFSNFKRRFIEIIYGIFDGAKILPDYTKNGNNKINLVIHTDLGILEVRVSKSINNSIESDIQVKWNDINYNLFNLLKDFNDLKIQIANLYSELINKIIYQIINEKS